MERYPRLRDLREDADLTQAQVGQALHLTQRAYAYYESGQRMLPPQVLCALARYYGVSVDYLLGETDVRALSGGEKAVRTGARRRKPQAFLNHASRRIRRRRAKNRRSGRSGGFSSDSQLARGCSARRVMRSSVGSSSASTMPFPAQMASRSGNVPNTNTGE